MYIFACYEILFLAISPLKRKNKDGMVRDGCVNGAKFV
mgnify:FL=1